MHLSSGIRQQNHGSRTFFLIVDKVEEEPSSQIYHRASGGRAVLLPEKMGGCVVMSVNRQSVMGERITSG